MRGCHCVVFSLTTPPPAKRSRHHHFLVLVSGDNNLSAMATLRFAVCWWEPKIDENNRFTSLIEKIQEGKMRPSGVLWIGFVNVNIFRLLGEVFVPHFVKPCHICQPIFQVTPSARNISQHLGLKEKATALHIRHHKDTSSSSSSSSAAASSSSGA